MKHRGKGKGGKFSLGLDFGSESARALLVDVDTGEIAAKASHIYADGVIDTHLPDDTKPLPPDWALQNPNDWLAALDNTIPILLSKSGIRAQDIIGLGIDFTSCTVLPTNGKGTPLCNLKEYRKRPHAWPKLWKHHAAWAQAERINTLARSRQEPWLARCGGRISSEWLMPKVLQIIDEDGELYTAAKYFVEGADWIAWQLTGRLVRNLCAAGYKANWSKLAGFPSADFLTALHPNMSNLYKEKMAGPIMPPGTAIGGLTPGWSRRLGLMKNMPVATPIIDAHAGMIGAGISEPHKMFMIMGTSTCHMLMSKEEVFVKGIAGVVEDGIVPGLFAYEAGQPAVGDAFAWLVNNAVPPNYHEEAARAGKTLHDLLAEKAASLSPGQSGLIALDWWNGNRSILVDPELSGMIAGYTLSTKPEEIYRALIEATAFGTRLIMENFIRHGIPVDSIMAGGGLTKNAFLMQIYSDIIGREVTIVGNEQASALGAAMLAAVAAGQHGGGYDSVTEATTHMRPIPSKVYNPISEHTAIYNTLYTEYLRLHDYFGGDNNVMKMLRRLRQKAAHFV